MSPCRLHLNKFLLKISKSIFQNPRHFFILWFWGHIIPKELYQIEYASTNCCISSWEISKVMLSSLIGCHLTFQIDVWLMMTLFSKLCSNFQMDINLTNFLSLKNRSSTYCILFQNISNEPQIIWFGQGLSFQTLFQTTWHFPSFGLVFQICHVPNLLAYIWPNLGLKTFYEFVEINFHASNQLQTTKRHTQPSNSSPSPYEALVTKPS
jgi:hypothetical protein